MADYFDLVGEQDGALHPSDIEQGLVTATINISAHVSQRKACTSVLLRRFVYADTDRCTPKATNLALGLLKVFGRHMSAGDEMATKEAIHGLLQLALAMHQRGQGDSQASDCVNACNEALTCVANAMLIEPKSKALFAETSGFETIAAILGSASESATSVLLCGRCLFLSLTTADGARHCVEDLELQNTLARATRKCLSVAGNKQAAGERFTPLQVMDELFKAAMSLTVYFQRSIHKQQNADAADPSSQTSDDSLPPEHAVQFLELLQASLDTLMALPLAQNHLSSPAKQAISILLNFSTQDPPSIKNAWFPIGDKWKHSDCILSTLVALVNCAVSTDTNVADIVDSYQAELAPLALVLVRLMVETPDIRDRAFKVIYPEGADYTQLPEDRPGISAKLVKVMKLPQGGMLPGAIGDLLYVLWGQDAKQFIMAVGYGNAAGYMLARGIEIPSDVMKQAKEKMDERLVDPVTGRYLTEDDVAKELANMTDEEKEREAERLFVLFERLNKTGIIKAENPIRAAYQSGKFEEIQDSSDSKADSNK
ncbi:hypothetical protein GQ54DRAFT_224752 [Martensiomyces pterosporus]|nr:hypothetical protein GQ54DRAFT_224752 [Martensiomyces pterosporus]